MTRLSHQDLRRNFRQLLASDTCYHTASVFDPMSARIAADLGFEVGILGGSVASLQVLGAPDFALITLSEFAEQATRIGRVAQLPVIADASAPLPQDPFAAVEPLESRTLLERLALEQFEMVGSLRGRQGRVALLRGAGSIHRIQLEDRLGPDHGRVVAISEHQVELVEQVFIEGRGWLERPRTLVLKQADRVDGR